MALSGLISSNLHASLLNRILELRPCDLLLDCYSLASSILLQFHRHMFKRSNSFTCRLYELRAYLTNVTHVLIAVFFSLLYFWLSACSRSQGKGGDDNVPIIIIRIVLFNSMSAFLVYVHCSIATGYEYSAREYIALMLRPF